MTVPVGVSVVPIADTVTWSVTDVPGATVPVWLEVVVVVVGATTWKHSKSAMVELDARKLVVSGV